MKPPTNIITTPDVERIRELLPDIAVTQSIGILQGRNGVGKTHLLHAALDWHTKKKWPGRAIYVRCGKAHALRGIRDLLSDLGSHAAEARRGLSHQMLVRLAADVFSEQNMGLLALDEADLWSIDALTAFVGMVDQLRAEGLAFSVLLAGAKPNSKWIGACGAGISRTLRVLRIAPLDKPHTAAVLRHWSPAGEKLYAALSKKDPDAKESLLLIWRGTGGLMRRLRYLSDLARLHHLDFTPETVPELLAKIDNG